MGLAHYFVISFAALWFQTVNKVSFSWLRANQMSLRFVTISLVRFLAMVGLNVYFIAMLGYGVLGILLSTLITNNIIGEASRIGFGSALVALPKKLSSSAVESAVWLSVEPTMPNL